MKYGIPKSGTLLTVALVFCVTGPALAEVRTITATGEYRMGDNDTRTDAKRLALLDAKRLALEQAGTYIESITEVKNLDLAKEEIRAYTAGIVEVIEQATRTMTEGDTTVVRVDVKTRINTDVVARQIEALRKNEDVRTKLLRAEAETLKLRKELDAKTHELTAAKSRTVAEAVTRQRQTIMTQADVEGLLSRAQVVLAGLKNNTLLWGSSTPESRKYARSLIEQALSFEPENSEAQGLLGFVQFEEGQREEATSTFRAIAKKEPLSAHAHMNLGRVLQASKDWFGAAMEYETARKLEPDYAEAHASLGQVLESGAVETLDESSNMDRKILEHAVEALREATRLAPRNATYHRKLGDALCTLANNRDFTRLGIKEEEVNRILAARRRDEKEGLAELHRAVELDPADAAAHKALAGRLQFGEEALAEYRAAIRLDPADAYTRIALGKLLLVRTEKDVNGAMAEFRAAVRIDPENAKAHLELGFALEEEMSQMDEAIEEYRKSVNLGSDALGAPLGFRVGVLSHGLEKVGQKKEAAKVIRDFLKLNPEVEPYFHKRLLELE